MMQFHFVSLGTWVFRRSGESDRAWARRRHSALVKHRKAERVRFRECQRRGIRFRPNKFEASGVTKVKKLDVGKITIGTIKPTKWELPEPLKAEHIEANTITATSIRRGAF